MFRRALPLLLYVLAMSQSALAEPQEKPEITPARSPAPTVSNFAYSKDSPRQVLDFWQAVSDAPTPVVLMIHGGGWRGGDKSMYAIAVQQSWKKGFQSRRSITALSSKPWNKT